MSSVAKKSKFSRTLLFEQLMAVIATINLGLVLFDLSYVPWRDFWLHGKIQVFRLTIEVPLPPITNWYDKYKGIEKHRETERYRQTVSALKNQLQQTGLQSPQVEQILEELRNLSSEMIETNPFQTANKSGTLEKIKNRMRDRIRNRTGEKIESSRQAFSIFWSRPYLSKAGWQREIEVFYQQDIEPLLETNYYRHIGENGEFIDRFWRIDLPFIALFGLEFLARTYYLHRRHNHVSWTEAMLWRWYDIFLLLPFFRWLRVIPVTIRLYHARLLNLDPVRQQINRGFVANFAEELTQVVVIRVINQIQGAIKAGEITRWLSMQANQKAYVDINNTNEVEAIAKVLMKVTVFQVIPKVQPDIEAILRHNIERLLNQSPVYQGLQYLPGLGHLPSDLIASLVKEVSQSTYTALTAALEDDPVGAELTNHLVEHFTEAVKSELQKNRSMDKIQSLLLDMLEEIKINYAERLSDEELEQILQQTRQIRQVKTLPSNS